MIVTAKFCRRPHTPANLEGCKPNVISYSLITWSVSRRLRVILSVHLFREHFHLEYQVSTLLWLATMSLFDYPTLEDPKEFIRLLLILSDVDHPGIECKLYRFRLAKCPLYVAVSYLWGSSTAEMEILLNKKPFSIRQNVWHFLWQMRTHKIFKSCFFWIDAICINQRDIDERNVQVSIMRRIYATAADVVVWLGNETPDSHLAMDYIARQKNMPLITKVSGGYRSHREPSGKQIFLKDEEGKALLALCQRPYWKRVWIVQEIMNAKRIIAFCGSKEFKWAHFDNLFRYLKSIQLLAWFDSYRYAPEVLASEAAVIVKEKDRWENRQALERGGICLSTLIELYRHLECTNPLDKVYGFLGLSSDQISIDYRKSPEIVYNEVLTLACKTQLEARHAKESFEALLLGVLGISKDSHSVLTVASLMYRPSEAENPIYHRSDISYRKSQPTIGEPELEATIYMGPLAHGFANRSEITNPVPYRSLSLSRSRMRNDTRALEAFELAFGRMR
jgi:hypothetical protein